MRNPPPKVLAVEPAEGVYFDGERLRQDATFVFDEDTIRRFRAGMICYRCWEPFDTSFPPTCPLCGYEVGMDQARDIERDYKGGTSLGPTTTVDEEIDALRERKRREREILR